MAQENGLRQLKFIFAVESLLPSLLLDFVYYFSHFKRDEGTKAIVQNNYLIEILFNYMIDQLLIDVLTILLVQRFHLLQLAIFIVVCLHDQVLAVEQFSYL